LGKFAPHRGLPDEGYSLRERTLLQSSALKALADVQGQVPKSLMGPYNATLNAVRWMGELVPISKINNQDPYHGRLLTLAAALDGARAGAKISGARPQLSEAVTTFCNYLSSAIVAAEQGVTPKVTLNVENALRSVPQVAQWMTVPSMVIIGIPELSRN